MSDQQRFLDAVLAAQAADRGGYATALSEIQAGQKRSHWIWYVWPVLQGVRSTSQPQFEIPSLEYANAWLHHPTLGPRLFEITSAAVTHLEAGVDAQRLFGSDVDAFKFHNCMTLFQMAASQTEPPNCEAQLFFQRVEQMLAPEPAEPTLELLSTAASDGI